MDLTEPNRCFSVGGVAPRLPLPTLLSQALVAFTIEVDNEFERQMPHRTTWGPAADSPQGPWLVSLAMWSNFMQYVASDGTPLNEIADLARITNLAGLQRWGYIVVEPDPADMRAKPPRSDWVVRPTAAGRKAQDVWRPLTRLIETRWRHRFGEDDIDDLRASLQALLNQLDVDLPAYLPVVKNALFSDVAVRDVRTHPSARLDVDGDLCVLMSRVLLAFTLDFEDESTLSLPISANALRVLDEPGVRVRDLPLLAGVSKEAISLSLGCLERSGCIVVVPALSDSRSKVVRLTPAGRNAQVTHRRLLGRIEAQWRAQFGDDIVGDLGKCLARLVGEPTTAPSRLMRDLEPYPDGWRASLRAPAALPHHPMVLHRGGFPDGS